MITVCTFSKRWAQAWRAVSRSLRAAASAGAVKLSTKVRMSSALSCHVCIHASSQGRKASGKGVRVLILQNTPRGGIFRCMYVRVESPRIPSEKSLDGRQQ